MRQITDAQRQVTVSIPGRKINLKWLFIGIVMICLIGGLVGGYYAFIDKVTPTATIQKPPVQPAPLPPVVATPTPKPTTQSPLQVEWQSTGPEGLIAVDRIVLMDESIYAIEQTGMNSFLIFRSESNSSTWQKLTANDTVYQRVAVDITTLRNDVYAGILTANDPHSVLSEILEVVRQIFGDSKSAKIYPMEMYTILAYDPNNPNLVVAGFGFGLNNESISRTTIWTPVAVSPPRLFLSIDGQKSWKEVKTTGIEFVPGPTGDMIRSLAVQKKGEAIRIFVGSKKVWQALLPATTTLP